MKYNTTDHGIGKPGSVKVVMVFLPPDKLSVLPWVYCNKSTKMDNPQETEKTHNTLTDVKKF